MYHADLLQGGAVCCRRLPPPQPPTSGKAEQRRCVMFSLCSPYGSGTLADYVQRLQLPPPPAAACRPSVTASALQLVFNLSLIAVLGSCFILFWALLSSSAECMDVLLPSPDGRRSLL